MWKENDGKPPASAKWERDWDGVRECMTAPYPVCPDCEYPLFSLGDGDRCEYCGRKILRDEALNEYQKPQAAEKMDCFRCGGKGTLEVTESRYNGHKHGYCTNCGMRFME